MSALRPIMGKGVAARLPLDLALHLIPSLPRPILARMVHRMIERMDEIDGDTDREANGDELDGDNAEDAFGVVTDWTHGPGCPIADPDACAVDSGQSIGGEP